jgi:membrane associated rhomboid family serine protease
MVIRTLRDYENDYSSNTGNNGSSVSMPMPPQWQRQGASASAIGGTYADLSSDQEQQQQPSTTMPFFYHYQQQQQEEGEARGFSSSDGMFWSWNLTGPPQWYHMVLLCCCPCFVGPPCSEVRKRDYKLMLQTFLFWITIVDIVYFIVELSIGGITNTEENPSIGPPNRTLILLGAKYVPKIKLQHQYWRLVVPIIMHSGFIHIIFNIYVQIMICLGFERGWGAWRTALLYIVSGIAGNLLSCCALPYTVSVGASGALMGIIGARIGDIVCRWSKMPRQLRISNGVNAGILLFFVVLMTFMAKNVDWAGHLGGLVVGFFLSFAVFSSEIEDKRIRYVAVILGTSLTFLFYLTTILVFALAVKVN